jgi:hypothetical protein
VPRLAIVVPIGEGCNDIDPVTAPRFSETDLVLESRFRADRPPSIVIVPAEAIRSSRIPRIGRSQRKECHRRFQVRGDSRLRGGNPAQRVSLLFCFRPVLRYQSSAPAGKAGHFWIRTAGPCPRTRGGGKHTYAERVPSIPESIDSLSETRAFQVPPEAHVRVRAFERTLRRKRRFLLLPDMHVRRCRGRFRGQ